MFSTGCASKVDSLAAIKDLENINQVEYNYLFYDMNLATGLENERTLYFPFDIKKLDIKADKAVLLQDDVIVNNNVTIKRESLIDNKVTIIISDFTPEFNRIMFTLESGETINLHTGQFYYEKWQAPVNNLENSEKWSLRHLNSIDTPEHDTNEIVMITKLEIELNKKGEESKLVMVLPEKFKKTGIKEELVKTEEKEGMVFYEYKLTIPLEFYQKQELNNLTFKMIWLQETLVSKQHQVIIAEEIPMYF